MVNRILTSMTMILVSLSLTIGEATAKRISPEDAAQVDSLYTEGLELFDHGHLDRAALMFQAAIRIDKKHAPSYVGLGHIHLNQKDLKAAEDAFRQALRKRSKYPPALNGLGLVFRDTDKMLDWAIKYFRSAYQADATMRKRTSILHRLTNS